MWGENGRCGGKETFWPFCFFFQHWLFRRCRGERSSTVLVQSCKRQHSGHYHHLHRHYHHHHRHHHHHHHHGERSSTVLVQSCKRSGLAIFTPQSKSPICPNCWLSTQIQKISSRSAGRARAAFCLLFITLLAAWSSLLIGETIELYETFLSFSQNLKLSSILIFLFGWLVGPPLLSVIGPAAQKNGQNNSGINKKEVISILSTSHLKVWCSHSEWIERVARCAQIRQCAGERLFYGNFKQFDIQASPKYPKNFQVWPSSPWFRAPSRSRRGRHREWETAVEVSLMQTIGFFSSSSKSTPDKATKISASWLENEKRTGRHRILEVALNAFYQRKQRLIDSIRYH